MKDAYSYYIEPFENFDQVIAWESPVRFPDDNVAMYLQPSGL